MGDLSKNFSSWEFECGCGCGFDEISIYTLEVLERVREFFKSSVSITSGCRCPDHNKREGGSERSQHLTGRAADIKVKGVPPKDVADYLSTVYPRRYGIGRYRTFTHIDTRHSRARWGKN